jgi:dipeptidyl aminopeptidase/acylaminoacyl peptidase
MSEIFVLRDADPKAVAQPYGTYFIFESHGSRVFGRIILPAFYDTESRCPVVLMLHGHPGGDKNWDVAEALRANGYAVMIFSYRGLRGIHGDYSMSHNIEDVICAVDELRKRADECRLDPERVFQFGHSMGGFSALNAIARGTPVKGAVLMAPYDAGFMYQNCRDRFDSVMACKAQGYFTLASENALEEDAAAHAQQWEFRNLLTKFDKHFPFCFIDGKQDRTSTHVGPIVEEMQQAGFRVTYHLLDDGHMFPLHRASLARIALQHFNGIK